MNNRDIPTTLSPTSEAMRMDLKALSAWLHRLARDDTRMNSGGWEEYWKARRICEILNYVEKMDKTKEKE